MSPTVWLALIISQFALVIGQVFLKKAMAENIAVEVRNTRLFLPLGIGFLAVWFLLWLGMMARLNLSQQMPLEALSPIFIMSAGVVFLKEKCGWRGWLGLVLTGLGVYLVASS